MQTRRELFKFAAWLTARHIAHYRAVCQLLSNIGVFVMRVASPEMLEHAQAVLGQKGLLSEMAILRHCLQMKKAVEIEGGWQSHHAAGLDKVAFMLVNYHDWDPVEVGEFVEELTEGTFILAGGDEDDE